jgi:hypothetical protein
MACQIQPPLPMVSINKAIDCWQPPQIASTLPIF